MMLHRSTEAATPAALLCPISVGSPFSAQPDKSTSELHGVLGLKVKIILVLWEALLETMAERSFTEITGHGFCRALTFSRDAQEGVKI